MREAAGIVSVGVYAVGAIRSIVPGGVDALCAIRRIVSRGIYALRTIREFVSGGVDALCVNSLDRAEGIYTRGNRSRNLAAGFHPWLRSFVNRAGDMYPPRRDA